MKKEEICTLYILNFNISELFTLLVPAFTIAIAISPHHHR
jgi:hypothetical protein